MSRLFFCAYSLGEQSKILGLKAVFNIVGIDVSDLCIKSVLGPFFCVV